MPGDISAGPTPARAAAGRRAFSGAPPEATAPCSPTRGAEDGAKVFKLDAAPYTWNVAPGVKKQAFAFNGTVPGPTIRVIEGDKVRVEVTNHLPTGTAVHWHGMVLPHKMDGVPGITQPPIEPGGKMVYEFVATATGTHWYHSHWDGDQVGKGLYGSLEIVPHTGDRAVDRDYRLFIGDSNLGFVINGRTYPGHRAVRAKVGEKIRIRLTPTGELSHPFHLHGQPFQLVAQDGFDLPQPVTMDTLLISTAQTFDIVTVALAPGRWMFHCHIFSHMHAPGAHAGHKMSGLVTTLDVAAGRARRAVAQWRARRARCAGAPVTPGPDNPPGGDRAARRKKGARCPITLRKGCHTINAGATRRAGAVPSGWPASDWIAGDATSSETPSRSRWFCVAGRRTSTDICPASPEAAQGPTPVVASASSRHRFETAPAVGWAVSGPVACRR